MLGQSSKDISPLNNRETDNDKASAIDRDKVNTTTAQDKFWAHFDELEEKLNDETKKSFAPGTAKSRAICKSFLFQFADKFMQMKKLDGDITDFLHASPPRPFWKLYMRFLCSSAYVHKKFIDGKFEMKDWLTTTTVHSRFMTSLTIYRQLFGDVVNKQEILESYLLLKDQDFIKESQIRVPKLQHWATFEDCKYLINNGVFGGLWVFKSARQRLQLAAILLLLAFTAARPGELICSTGYESENEGLKYKDLTFYADKLDDGTISLAVDVQIRNLKGLRHDDNAVRIQPIYQDNQHLSPLHDATFLLVVLGFLDEVFEDFDTIEEMLSIDPESVEQKIDPNSYLKRTKLIIKESKLNQLVFREIDCCKQNEWNTHPTKAWRLNSLVPLVRKVANKVGMKDFTLYTLRRGCATAINDPNVTENDAQLAIGHNRGTPTYRKHYLSKRTQIDIQGLMSIGREARERLSTTSLERISQEPLSVKDRQSVEDDPDLLKARLGHEKLRIQIFEAQLKEFGLMGISEASDIPLSIHHSQKFQDIKDESLKAPLAAYQASARAVNALRLMLRQQARYKKAKEVANLNRKEAIKSPRVIMPSELSDNLRNLEKDMNQDHEDGETNRDNDQYKHQMEQETQKEDRVQARQKPKQAGASTQASKLLSAIPEVDVASIDAITASSSASASTNTPLCLKPDHNAILVDTILRNVKQKYANDISPNIDFQNLLDHRDDATSVAAEAYAALISNYGTRSFALARRCPTCNQSHKTIGQGHGLSHYIECTRNQIIEEVQANVASVFAGHPCVADKCGKSYFQLDNNGDGRQRIVQHLTGHLKARMQCAFQDPDGKRCLFKGVAAEKANNAESSQYSAHLGSHHGVVHAGLSTVVFCAEHLEWLIGEADVQKHFEAHLSATNLNDMPEKQLKEICPFCWNDNTIRPSARAKPSHVVSRHLSVVHLPFIQDCHPTCPVCLDPCDLAALADHLIDHGYPLAGQAEGSVSINKRCNGNLENLVRPFYTEEQKVRLKEWIEYVQDPSVKPSQQALNLTNRKRRQRTYGRNNKKLRVLADISNL